MPNRAHRRTRRRATSERVPEGIVAGDLGVNVQLDRRGQLEACLELRLSEFGRLLRKKLDDEALVAAVEAPTDFDALILSLERSGPEVFSATDPLFAAKLRGLQARKQLTEDAGGLLSSPQVAKLLNMTNAAVHKRIKANTLLAVNQGKRGNFFPAFQFTQNGEVLTGVAQVVAELAKGGHDGWGAVRFFLSDSDRLEGRTPLAALRDGEVDRVVHAARWYGQQGGS